MYICEFIRQERLRGFELAETNKMEKWYEELSKISHVLQDTLNIRENVTRAKSGEERRLCVLLNRVDALRVFISYLLKKDEGSIRIRIVAFQN